jgi:hypothetical protein
MCLECSGIHRMLGTHITRIKSTTLDKWRPEWVQVMRAGGNVNGNAEWEARLPPGKGLNPSSPMDDRERFIRAKYERQTFRGPATRESLIRAAAKMGCSVDDSGEVSPVVAADSSGGVDATRVSPAVARRLAAKKAKEEAEAEETARAAEEEARRKAEQEAADRARREAETVAAVGDLFGGSAPAPAPADLSFLGGGDESTGFAFVAGTAEPTSTGFAFVAGTTTESSGFAFVGESAEPGPSGFAFMGGSAEPEPSGFDFAGGITERTAAEVIPSSGFDFTTETTTTDTAPSSGFGLTEDDPVMVPGSSAVHDVFASLVPAPKASPPGMHIAAPPTNGVAVHHPTAPEMFSLLTAKQVASPSPTRDDEEAPSTLEGKLSELEAKSWVQEYAALGSVHDARSASQTAAAEHHALMEEMRAMYTKEAEALANKFRLLEARLTKVQHVRMFSLQQRSVFLQRQSTGAGGVMVQ